MNNFKLLMQVVTLSVILSVDIFAGGKENHANRGKETVKGRLQTACHAAQDTAGASDQDSFNANKAAQAAVYKYKKSLNANGKRKSKKR